MFSPIISAAIVAKKDSYSVNSPWVCVLMLSDVDGMIGGETEIKKGDGTFLKALGPNIGSVSSIQVSNDPRKERKTD